MLQGVLDQPLFTVWMDGNISKEVVGELTFGGINPKYYNGALVQIPTNNPVSSLHSCLITCSCLHERAVLHWVLLELYGRCPRC